MRIAFHKLSDARHRLEIVRTDGSRETVECETRSYLVHDLLHYAVECEAGLAGGFWGQLTGGRTLADLNDRTGEAMAAAAPELAAIERIVGALSAAVKGGAPSKIATGLHAHALALGTANPSWLTPAFVEAVQERMRRLLGHWSATRYGGAMELEFPG